MKKKWLLTAIMVVGVLAVSTAVIAAVSAGVESNGKNAEERASLVSWVERTDVPETKKIEVYEKTADETETGIGVEKNEVKETAEVQNEDASKLNEGNDAYKQEETTLSYEKSHIVKETTYDIYTGENEGEYIFNEDGVLVIYEPSEQDLGPREITKDEAIEIARNELTRLYGSKMERFVLKKVHDYGGTFDTGGSWRISFTDRYGENGFIHGETMTAVIRKDGCIEYCQYNDEEWAGILDESILRGVTEEEVTAWVDSAVKAKDYTITDIYLKYEDSVYKLAVFVDRGEEYFLDAYYYVLPGQE